CQLRVVSAPAKAGKTLAGIARTSPGCWSAVSATPGRGSQINLDAFARSAPDYEIPLIQVNGNGYTSIKVVSARSRPAMHPRMAATVNNWETTALLEPVERDVRLDFFRGIGLWMIFLDHIPHDVVSWLTLRNYGFSDAAEFFVFISGYLVGWIYAPIVRGGLFLAAVKRL